MQHVIELSLTLRVLDTATYSKQWCGITFLRVLLFQRKQKVPTDRLIVTDEGVRVVDIRE